MHKEVIMHYDKLIDENNDPVHDPKPLKEYMDKWDGQIFIDEMELSYEKNALEIGVGTGRVAQKIIDKCNYLTGIDISPKTIERAQENLKEFENKYLICDNFMEYVFNRTFDIIYSTLTFMHIEDKQAAINKAAELLNERGRFVLSIQKSLEEYIDYGDRKIRIYPETPANIKKYIKNANMDLVSMNETEFTYIFTCVPY